MAKFAVTLEDGRVLEVYAPGDKEALTHAKKHEQERVSSERHSKIAGNKQNPDFSVPVSVAWIKD